MKLYRAYRRCEGEYSCDNYMGLFKTVEGMLEHIDKFVRENLGNLFSNVEEFKNFSVLLDDKGKLIFLGTGRENWIVEDIKYEVINTDDLS